ncbi:hypothetical protein H4R19_006221, partial [Coemansia spiralis]
NQSDDDMDFDLDGIDDASVFDMVGDLETHRPIIYENPSFSFAAAGGGYAGPGATPVRTPGSAASASSAGSAMAPRVAMDGTPTAARNLAFHPPQPSPTQQGRPRSFADITSFVPSSAVGGVQQQQQQQQQPRPGN